MLMAVNLANSQISIGFFADDACELKFQCKLATDLHKTSDEYLCLIRSIVREESLSVESISGAILASVVPQLTATVSEVLYHLTGAQPILVGPGVKTGFAIKIDSPSELGGDMVANTVAALDSLGGEKRPMMVVDMGTVTTVSAISRAGEYLGCSICPGIGISLDSLHGRTAQLPNVMLAAPERAIGKNSQDSVRSGVIYGHAMMLDGFVLRFAKEMRCTPQELVLVMTGTYAKSVSDVCKYPFEVDEHLTLKGLWTLYRKTVQEG